jgi:hypothetical protein
MVHVFGQNNPDPKSGEPGYRVVCNAADEEHDHPYPGGYWFELDAGTLAPWLARLMRKSWFDPGEFIRALGPWLDWYEVDQSTGVPSPCPIDTS